MTVIHTRKQAKTRARLDKEAAARKHKGVAVKFVPVDVVRNHIFELHKLGWSYVAIAQQAGVSHAVVYRIASRDRETVHPRTATALMQVSPRKPTPLLDDVRWVPAVGVRRRIQALQRVGHRREDIAAVAGVSMSVIRKAADESKVSVTRANWDAICKAYDELSARPGTSKVTASRAEAKGWLSPWDWEAANIDDPYSYPPRAEGPSRGDLKRQAAALDGPHITAEALAERLGVSARTIVRWRTERKKENSVE